jgi:hypothetical protein
MTDNEKKARKIMEATIRSGVSHLRTALYLVEDKTFPELTDAECMRVAINYPVRLQEIRDVFPRVKL